MVPRGRRVVRLLVRLRVPVLLAWGALGLVGVFAAFGLSGRLSTSLSVPGAESQRADAVLARDFGQNVEGGFTIVVPVQGDDAARLALIGSRLRHVARQLPGAHLTTLEPAGGILQAELSTPLDLARAADITARVRGLLQRAGLKDAGVTGAPALQHDLTPVLAADLHRGEAVAVVVALAVLVLILGPSPLAVLPLVVAGATMAGALALVDALSHVVLMVLYVPNLVALVALGVGVDYGLLFAHRFREELVANGGAVEDALVVAWDRAGRTVLASGLAVAVGLSALLVVSVPFVRSLGVAALVVPLVAVVAALSLCPALLSFAGARTLRSARRRAARQGTWRRVAALVVRRRVTLLTGSLLVLGGLAVPGLWLRVTPGSLTALPHDLPAARTLAVVRNRVGGGSLTPIEVVIETGTSGGALRPAVSGATLRLARALLADPAVEIVAVGTRPPYVDAGRRSRLVVVVGREDFGAPATLRLVGDLRTRLVPAARFPAKTTVLVGGAPAQGVDFIAHVDGELPLVLALVLVLAFVVLVVAFGSPLLALGAIVLDALSVAATFGLLVLVFRVGIGADVAGLYRVGAVEAWVPVFLVALLFGLSMDYEVFLVRRMREARDAGLGTGDAVIEGMARTGRIVSAAALVMVGALSGLWLGRVAGLQELGVGLALGVALDAIVVRGVLLPSVVAVLGEANWWHPLRRAPRPPDPVRTGGSC